MLISIPKNNRSVGQYSVLDIEPILEATQELVDYQSELSHLAHFGDILLAGSKAMHPDTKIQWTAFLKQLEPQVEKGGITKEKAHSLNEMIALLENFGVLSAWMTLFFPASYSPIHSPLEILDLLLNDLPEWQIDSVHLLLKEKAALQSSRGRMDDLADPNTFEKAWEELQRIVKHFTVESQTVKMKELLTESAPLVQMMALETMKELVDVFDSSIKSMKASSKWCDEEKVKQFNKMLHPYKDLLQDWGKNLIDTSSIPVHKGWTCNIYLEALNSLLDFNLKTNHSGQLNPSSDFSVAAAVLGSTTAFNRHYPNTLEDFFTLVHQNLLMFVSNLNNQLCQQGLLEKARFPLLISGGLESINGTNLGRNIQRTGMEISDQGIDISYNVPLGNHSGQILVYDKETGNVKLKALLLGKSTSGRWNFIKLRAFIFDKAALLRLVEPVYVNRQEVSFSWEIKNLDELKVALSEYNKMAEISMGSIEEYPENYNLDNLLFQKSLDSDKYQLRDFMEDLQKMILENDESLSLVAHCELKKLLSIEKLEKYCHEGIYEKFISFIQREIQNPQPKIRQIAFELLTKLCEMGYGIPDAIAVCDDWLDNDETEILCIDLYSKLVAKGYCFEKASKIIEERINSKDRDLHNSVLRLLCELISQDQQVANGIIAAVKYFQSFYTLNELSMELWTRLLSRDQGFDEAISLAKSSNNNPFWNLILAKGKGKGVDEANYLAEKGIASDKVDEQINAIGLYRQLVKNKYSINTAIHVAKNTVSSTIRGVKFLGQLLWSELQNIGAVDGPIDT
ncbi:MAG: hypothetical protein H0W50_06395 [Parachlamydiaceae bacterium]|nr:hypothetical protein [Parachlamydiaceae bacterium]